MPSKIATLPAILLNRYDTRSPGLTELQAKIRGDPVMHKLNSPDLFVFGVSHVASLFSSPLPCSLCCGCYRVRIKTRNDGRRATTAGTTRGVRDHVNNPERTSARAVRNSDMDLSERNGMHRQRFVDGRAQELRVDECDAANTRRSNLQPAMYRGRSSSDPNCQVGVGIVVARVRCSARSGGSQQPPDSAPSEAARFSFVSIFSRRIRRI